MPSVDALRGITRRPPVHRHPALVAQQEAEWSTIATNVARFFEEELAAPPSDDVMFY